MFETHTSDYLRRAREALLHPIPGDATFLATVANFLRSHIDAELASPERAERDKAEAQALKEAIKAKAAADLEAKHKAEQEALTPPTAEERLAAQKAALDEKQAAEKAALDEEARVRAIDQSGYEETPPVPPKSKRSERPYA